MKKLILIAVLFASGCSFLPTPHDPAMFDNLVTVKVAVDGLSCDNKNNTWDFALHEVHHLALYSSLRGDLQSKSIGQLEEALTKAKSTNSKLVCEDILKINQERINVVVKAWSGR
jgi:hypothetical protein